MNFKKLTSIIAAFACISSLVACDLSIPSANVPPADPTLNNHASIIEGDDNNNTTEPVEAIDDNNDPEVIEEDLPVATILSFDIPDFAERQYSEEQLIEASEAYLDYLEQLDNATDSDNYFNLHFLPIQTNASNLMDIAYCYDYSHAASVTICRYNFETKEVEDLGSFGSYGSMAYYPGCNIFYTFYSGMGYNYFEYLYLDENNKEVSLHNFQDDSGLIDFADYEAHPEDYEGLDLPELYFRVNDEDVTEEEYNALHKAWREVYGDLVSLSIYDMMPYNDMYDVNFYQAYNLSDDELNETVSAYQRIIDDLDENSRYTFVNINNPAVPALAVCAGENRSDYVSLYQYVPYDEEVYFVGDFGSNGCMQYLYGSNLFVSYYGDGNYLALSYYKNILDGQNSLPIISFEFTNDEDSNHEITAMYYFINGEPVSEDFFNFCFDKFAFQYDPIDYSFMYDDKSAENAKAIFSDLYYER